MTLTEFAKKYRLKINRDDDYCPIIRGKRTKSRKGERKIADFYKCGLLIFSVTDTRGAGDDLTSDGYTTKGNSWWVYLKKRCLRSGMSLHQDGDDEGSFLFDPTDPEQAKCAIKDSGARPKRQVSEAERERLIKQLEKARAAQGVGA